MAQPCTVCTHPDAITINEALVLEKASNRAITRQYGLSKDAIRRHRQHIPELLLKASQAMEIAQADDLLDQVKDLQRRALGILDKAEAADDLKTALSAIGQARGNLELLGKLAGELQQEATTNYVFVSPAAIESIVAALAPYPEAGYAVSDVLKELEANEIR